MHQRCVRLIDGRQPSLEFVNNMSELGLEALSRRGRLVRITHIVHSRIDFVKSLLFQRFAFLGLMGVDREVHLAGVQVLGLRRCRAERLNPRLRMRKEQGYGCPTASLPNAKAARSPKHQKVS